MAAARSRPRRHAADRHRLQEASTCTRRITQAERRSSPRPSSSSQACGQPNGLHHRRSPTAATGPRRSQAAQALQASLAAVGIKTTLHGYPTATYYSQLRGRARRYVHAHDLGICLRRLGSRLAGRLRLQFSRSSDGAAIVPAGNTNIGELNDPVVNNLFTKMQAAR